MEANKKGHNIFQKLKEKNSESRVLPPVIISLRNEGEIKTFSDEEKLRAFVTRRPT